MKTDIIGRQYNEKHSQLILKRLSMNKFTVAALLALSLAPAALQGQTGLLVVAHGADSGWNARVHATVSQVHWSGPVATAFLMGPEADSSGWSEGVQSLVRQGAKRIVVVPLMVSTFGGHVRQIEYYAGVRNSLPDALMDHDHGMHAKPPVPTAVTGALDDAPELVSALSERWRELGPQDQRRPVLLVAHGPNDSLDAMRWLANLRGATNALSASAHADARVALLRDDAPAEVRAASIAAMRDTVLALAGRVQDSVVVIPVMISSGSITQVKIPHDLANLPIRYHARPLAPLPELARWMERKASEATSHAASRLSARPARGS
jgi:sirohydrochlorin ferrochelatase